MRSYLKQSKSFQLGFVRTALHGVHGKTSTADQRCADGFLFSAFRREPSRQDWTSSIALKIFRREGFMWHERCDTPATSTLPDQKRWRGHRQIALTATQREREKFLLAPELSDE